MPADDASINLTHHFLIAMPGMQDQAFARSVVYLCEHSARGALGLVIDARGRPLVRSLPSDPEARRDRIQQWLWDMGA